MPPEKLTVEWLIDGLDKLMTGAGLCLETLKEAAESYNSVQESVDLIENLLLAS